MSEALHNREEVRRLLYEVAQSLRPVLTSRRRMTHGPHRPLQDSHTHHIRNIIEEAANLLQQKTTLGSVDADKILEEWKQNPPQELFKFSKPEEASAEVMIVLEGIQGVLKKRHAQEEGHAANAKTPPKGMERW